MFIEDDTIIRSRPKKRFWVVIIINFSRCKVKTYSEL